MFHPIADFLACAKTDAAKTIRSSVTYRAYRRNSLVIGLLFLLHTAVLIWQICGLIQYPVDYLTFNEVGFFLFYVAVMLPWFCYTLWQQLRLLVRADRYVFREVLLDQPRVEYRSVVFTLVIPDEQERKRQMETVPTLLTMVDYVNQTALVGYNPETGLAVIIRPLHGRGSILK